MIVKKNESIDMPDDNPFLNDKFGMELIADNLTKIINVTQGGLVISINSGWGKGKTTFLKMWRKKLDKEEKHKTVYFNAWENDDNDDPLIALIGELEENLFSNPKNKEIINTIKKSGHILLKGALPAVLRVATNGLFDLQAFKLGKFNETQIIDTIGKLGEFELDGFKRGRKARDGFKKALQDFQEREKKKIVFFIDELDRCRPTFAIETLERIKHLFNIDGFIFILALDKAQLSTSIKTLYGQRMDSDGYLRRFFDLEYQLPEPNRTTYIDFLLDNYNLRNSKTLYFEKYLKAAINVHNLSLRDIDKLFYYLKLILPITQLFNSEDYIPIHKEVLGVVYSLFPIIKMKHMDIYQGFINKSVDTVLFDQKVKISQIAPLGNNHYAAIITNLLGLNARLNRNGGLSYDEYTIGTDRMYSLIGLLDQNKTNFEFIKQLEFADRFLLSTD